MDTLPLIQHLTIPVAFFYATRIEKEVLTVALSRTLARYPVMAGALHCCIVPVLSAQSSHTGRLAQANRAVTRSDTTLPHVRAGRFDVLLCNAGVSFDVFSCSGALSDFDGFSDASVLDRHTQPINNSTPPRFCVKLNTSSIVAGHAPLGCFRLTELKCGGCILGMTFSHLAVDGHSALAFCAAWSSEHEALLAGKAPLPLPAVLRGSGAPDFNRATFIRAATTPPDADIPPDVRDDTLAWHAQAALLVAGIRPAAAVRRVSATVARILFRKNATFTIRITEAQLNRIRAAAAMLDPGSALITPNDALLGLAWATLRQCRTRGVEGPPRLGPGRSQVLVQTVDLRRFLPALPLQYYGNASWAVPLTAPAGLSDPLRLALACRASFDLFCNSTVLYDQAASLMLQEPGSDGGRLGNFPASLLPLYSDGMFSSWYAPVMWSFSFGAGPARFFHGGVFPAASWGFMQIAGRPDLPQREHLLCGCCPAAKLAVVRAAVDALLTKMAGPEPEGTAPAEQPSASSA